MSTFRTRRLALVALGFVFATIWLVAHADKFRLRTVCKKLDNCVTQMERVLDGDDSDITWAEIETDCSDVSTCKANMRAMLNSAACGNATVETGEQCDDGNVVDGDGCSAACQVEGFCGDGILDTTLGEQCDDGNTADSDGCSSACLVEATPSGTGLFSAAYDDMRSEFLNLDASYVMEWRPGEGTYADATADHGFVRFSGQPNGTYSYGYQTECVNSLGVDSICFVTVRSATAANWPCGSDPVPPQTYETCPECACAGESYPGDTTWWMGVNKNTDYLGPQLDLSDSRVYGADIRNGPANRLCTEIELTPTEWNTVKLTASKNGHDILQHTERAATTLQGVTLNMGIYTNLFTGENSTDVVEGGTNFQGGGAHYYDTISPYNYRPHHRGYPVTDRVFMFCQNDAPTGVRSGMGASYYVNPNQTVVADDGNGHTEAYALIPYLTRIYWFTRPSSGTVTHPFTVKVSRIVWAYEENEVELLAGAGSKLMVDATDTTDPDAYVTFTATLYNWAAESRTYYISVLHSGNIPRFGSFDKFRIWWDKNADGLVDGGDQELVGEGSVTLPADTDIPLIFRLKPWWNTTWQGRNMTQAHIWFQEVGRLRGTGITARLWQFTTAEMSTKAATLATLKYPGTDHSDTRAMWNKDKPNNSRLVKNSPDFQTALTRMP